MDMRKPTFASALVLVAFASADVALAGDMKVKRIREFQCDAAAVGDRMEVGVVEGGGAKEALYIRPVGADCNFHLFHASTPGTESKLSPAPGGYQLAHAIAIASGPRAICASNAVHQAANRGNPRERSVRAVPILCWVGKAGAFSPAMTVVPPDAEYAAWIREVRSGSRDGSTWQVEWTRDFSFQFMNMSDAGRPGTDGVYETTFTLQGGKFAVTGTQKISDKTVDEGSTTAGPWNPSPEEMEEFQRMLDSKPSGEE